MVEDCKYVARIICGECGEGLVHGDYIRKPISLFTVEGGVMAADTLLIG
jgi:hypothetical protein